MCLGIPGLITQIVDPQDRIALVDISGVRRRINVACVVDDDHPVEACVGQWVLVHVGFAMSRIDPEEARKTLALIADMDQLRDELEQLRAPEET